MFHQTLYHTNIISRATKTPMKASGILLLCCIMLSKFILSNTTTDTIAANQPIQDGETIVSAGKVFELGFFNLGTSTKRYVGIWYVISRSTIVWVANRETPVLDSSGTLKITNQGILFLVDSDNTTIWSSNVSRRAEMSPVAQLLDSGNLVVRDGNNDSKPENILWQSFDYPGNTLLPRMKHGRNIRTGLDMYLSSWKSDDDPAEGQYTMKLDPHGYPQFFIRKNSVIQLRTPPWNGVGFSGMNDLKPNTVYNSTFVFNTEEMYYLFETLNKSVLFRSLLNPDGSLLRYIWNGEEHNWKPYQTVQLDTCDTYGYCGVYGSCNIANTPVCGCLKGFVPKSPKDWETAEWSKGCVRRTSLDCQKGDGFVNFTGIKFPDTNQSWFNRSMTIEECKKVCLKNCSCTAYTSLDIRGGGSGCLLWFGGLMDIREYPENGLYIYIRMASSEIDDSPKGQVHSNEQKRRKIIVISTLFSGLLFLGLGATLYVWKGKKKMSRNIKERGHTTENQKEDLELPLFDFATIANATDNFSTENMLGEGGFGPVYKGVLQEGQEIAVKRLSQNSQQGSHEFKNEVLCIAKLQHRNLVKLLGCCIEEQKMIIYEYMPNKSLDDFIFDKTKGMLLNWGKRYHIIDGIARGLLYLHQDSRLRIIHRDLKASNILLDFDMNPKISDFGMARSFGGNETQANTTRVVGTYGYMSPEYAIDGLFSVKSDVFSFGVMVLEIVSGKKNRSFHHQEHSLNLLGHAWILHKEGRALELIDESVSKSCNLAEALRAIHIGLLCVQQRPEDRPSMSNVVVMLSSEYALPQPKQPGFFTGRNPLKEDSSLSKQDSCSANEMTLTLLSAR